MWNFLTLIAVIFKVKGYYSVLVIYSGYLFFDCFVKVCEFGAENFTVHVEQSLLIFTLEVSGWILL